NRIVVRKADEKEAFTTLDGRARELNSHDLVIADGEKPACIAGVFGGLNSGVSDHTTRIFLESAVFDPPTIRGTARRHGLNTDASFRFERGVDPDLPIYALKRAALLLKEVAGATISSQITDINSLPKTQREVHIKFSEIEKLAGLSIPKDDVVRILESLDFRIKERNDRALQITVPHYRVDVYRSADMIEEILRIHGLDHVPLPERLMVPPVIHDALNIESLRQQWGMHLASRGMREIMTASLISGERIQRNSSRPLDLVTLRNPLSNELDVLRPTMLVGMMQSIAHNINRQQRDLRFFERGRIYFLKNGKAVEKEHLSIAITGNRSRDRWRSIDRKVALPDLKEELESLLSRLGVLDEVEWKEMENDYFNQAHEVIIKGQHIGMLGEVKGAILKDHDISQPVFFAELDEQVILGICRSGSIAFKEISRFPAVRRDLSLLIDNAIKFDRLRKVSFNAERKLLKDVDLFDVYQGEKLPAGKKSYAMRFTLQDPERTLTDEHVEKAMMRIRQAIEKETGAELRA
ncbi:MAG: phenylalanine--tRNA ligase subunit beta, partial [Bacteroidota bacterium]|nr:phenylalanine--tRNA ligase subunit beta [Bacteroidota bacterium]